MDTIDKINALLKERGMNGAELSRAIGVSSAVYSQWNTRKTTPSNKSIAKVATVLGVPVSELTDDPSSSAQKESPPPIGSGPQYPPEYDLLSPEDKKLVDDMIRSLARKK